MVATRNHPRDFDPPAPTESPTKRSTRSTTTGTTPVMSNELAPPPESKPIPDLTTTSAFPPKRSFHRPTRSSSLPAPQWSHTPSNLTLLWLLISLPLVLWDTGYVLLRPYTLPGGSLHWPLWAPYKLYGTVDMVYSPEAWYAGVGFTAAQGSINLIETIMYAYYLYLVYAHGQQDEKTQGRGAPSRKDAGVLGWMGEARTVRGREATVAVLVGYTTFVLTFSKTVLYWLNEAFGGFHGVGHNSWMDLVFLWIIPNGAWLVFPVYLGYVFGLEIVQGLSVAAEGGKKFL